jgi:hypothetical protein
LLQRQTALARTGFKAANIRTAIRGQTFHDRRFRPAVTQEIDMEPRRWLPYRNLKSRHLGLALATARVVAWIGMLLIAAGVTYGIAGSIARGGDGFSVLVAGTAIGLVGYGLIALVLSGILAALIGIEESQRRRLERD